MTTSRMHKIYGTLTDLEEAGEDLGKYTSLRNFFMRSLKEGCRPLDPDACCLV